MRLYPPIAWITLTLACVVVGVIWIFAWINSPWPVVGWVVGCTVLSVPLWVGIGAIKKRN